MLCWKNLSVEYSTLKREAIFGRFFFPFIFAILKCVFLSGLSITFYKLPCCVFFFFIPRDKCKGDYCFNVPTANEAGSI